MITPLQSKVFVHVVLLLVPISRRKERRYWRNGLCEFVYYQLEQNAKLVFRQFFSFQSIPMY